MKKLNPIMISGKEVLPLIEGGKGINASDGRSSGAWAHENCVGTFSGVSPDFYDSKGNVIIEKFFKRARPERHEEMVEYAIRGGIAQAQVAHEVSGGNGRIPSEKMEDAVQVFPDRTGHRRSALFGAVPRACNGPVGPF